MTASESNVKALQYIDCDCSRLDCVQVSIEHCSKDGQAFAGRAWDSLHFLPSDGFVTSRCL